MFDHVAWNCWFVLRRDDEIWVLRYSYVDDALLATGWEIVDWFRADTREEALALAAKW